MGDRFKIAKFRSRKLGTGAMIAVALAGAGYAAMVHRRGVANAAPSNAPVPRPLEEIYASQRQSKPTPSPQLTVTPGPTGKQLREDWERLVTSGAVNSVVQGNYRLLRITLHLEDGPDKSEPKFDTYRAQVWNYQRHKAYDVVVKLGASQPKSITDVVGEAPVTNDEEEEAIKLLMKNPAIAKLVNDGDAVLFPSMPGVLPGFRDRTLAIGIEALKGRIAPSGLFAVNVTDGTVAALGKGRSQARSTNEVSERASEFSFVKPETAAVSSLNVMSAALAACTPPNSAGSDSGGTDGTQSLSVSWGNWQFTVTRPWSSGPQSPLHDLNAAGGKGSGVELTSVFWKSKKMMHRAHVPILNVKYNNGDCGPYRDWVYEESQFQAPSAGNGVVDFGNSGSTTILDTHNDVGNFKGVAIWRSFDAAKGQNKLTVLSEIRADWYRYVSKWTFYEFGTLLPEWGFEGTNHRCTCFSHTHHPYWRWDFDIGDAGNDKIYEFASFSYKQTEFSSPRNFSSGSIAVAAVQDNITNDYVNIYVGPNDGTVKNALGSQGGFGVNDWWGLQFNSNEYYDGVSTVTGANAYAHLDNFVNGGASVFAQDVVIWYAAHFVHDGDGGSHWVGPTLSPSW